MTNATQTAPTLTADAANSAEILRIRAEHGGHSVTCPICVKPADAPYRRLVGGVIVEGCVDAMHTGRISGESAAWHVRPSARAMRKDRLADMRDRRAA